MQTMHHITILKEGLDPLEAIEIPCCINCSAGCTPLANKYHCPLCPASKFGPKYKKSEVTRHLKVHFQTQNPTVACVAGYKVARCYQDCVAPERDRDIKFHYHCPLCPNIVLDKNTLLEHVSRHGQESSSSAIPSTTNTNTRIELKQYLQDFSTSLEDTQSVKKSNKSGAPIKYEEKGDVHSIIREYYRNYNTSVFEEFFNGLSNEKGPAAKLVWLAGMTECASLLDKKADKIILSFMKIPFFTSQELAKAANNFIRTLIGYHNYYAYHILKRLFQHLIPVVEVNKCEELLISAGAISEEEEAMYDRVITTILNINSDIPLTQDTLLTLARKSMPYFDVHVHKHAVYTRNLLLLASRLPHLRPAVLEVIVANMITVDVHAPRAELAQEKDDDDDDSSDDDSSDDDSSDDEDVFNMEMEDCEVKKEMNTCKSTLDDTIPLDPCQVPRPMSHKGGNKLDVLMSIMLQYVHDVSHGTHIPTIPKFLERREKEVNTKVESSDCRPGYIGPSDFDPKRMGGCECSGHKQDVESIKLLYSQMKDIFSSIILRTHASSHVQFLLFYVISLRPGLLPFFADFLITQKFKNPNSSQCIRKNAMAYVGSLLSRGKHITLLDVHACLESIRDWCIEYLEAQERAPERNYEDSMLHGSFYSACQTLFYVFTFRYKQYTENKKTLSLARNLNLDRFIHSKLNPLHVCSPVIVTSFAAIAQHYQIAYCYTILEKNKRLAIPATRLDDFTEPVAVLEAFFPFDPYLLNRSKLYIQNHYREFDGLPEDITNDDCMDMDDEPPNNVVSPASYDMMCGTSPGFVRFSRFTEENIITGYF